MMKKAVFGLVAVVIVAIAGYAQSGGHLKNIFIRL
jgi:hypothetical protein